MILFSIAEGEELEYQRNMYASPQIIKVKDITSDSYGMISITDERNPHFVLSFLAEIYDFKAKSGGFGRSGFAQYAWIVLRVGQDFPLTKIYCKHRWVDTGAQKTWCKDCNKDGRWTMTGVEAQK